MTRRPNVVVVFADQMRAQATGYAGDPNAITPALDRLAAQSVNVTHAVSGHPVCCPYRASLLTGQYPLTHGVYVNDVPLRDDAVSIAKVFAAAGYETGYIGKWHVHGSPDGAYNRRRAPIPPESRQGFDYWKAFECSHNYMASPYYEGDDLEPQLWEGYDAAAQTEDACRYLRAHAASAGTVAKSPFQGRDRPEQARGAVVSAGAVGDRPEREDRLEREDRPERGWEGAPFFLMLSWGPPHDPYDMAPEAYKALFREREMVLRANVPEHQREAATAALRGYYAHIAALDDCVGRLLATLDETGLAEETIFVFTSDHGDMLYSQGLRAKHGPWDEAIRVPFLLRLPETLGDCSGALGDAGREVALPLDAPDIMPTLLGLCGLAIPPSVEGRDFSPEILGEREPDADAAALLSVPVSYGMLRTQGLPPYRGLRTRRYTYARATRGPWLLYDNEVDPYQRHNLIDDPAHADLQARLAAQLQTRLDHLGDAFLPGDAYLERDHLTHYREATSPWGEIETPWTEAEEWENGRMGEPRGRDNDS